MERLVKIIGDSSSNEKKDDDNYQDFFEHLCLFEGKSTEIIESCFFEQNKDLSNFAYKAIQLTMKLLIIDDEKDIQRLFTQRFRKEIRKGEIEIDFAFSSTEALTYLRKSNYEVTLVLLDINMPNMSGLELLQIIRKSHPTLTIMMVTAYGDAQNKQTAFEFGADDYLLKPLDFAQLKEKLWSHKG